MKVGNIQGQVILFAALDWGMGHVTRSIGIIEQLLSQKNEIIVACDEEQKMFFKSYFPELTYEYLKGYNLKFSNKGNWTLDLLKSSFRFFNAIQNERKFIQQFEKLKQIDFVISDHRYGFYSSTVPSIFVTHQLHLPVSKFTFSVQFWHTKQLNNFTVLWVLDSVQNSFAGKLSKPINHKSIEYIGLYSRFKYKTSEIYDYDYLIVVSGPKSYALNFISEIKLKIDFSNKRVAVLYPPSYKVENDDRFTYYKAIDLKHDDELFYKSRKIISRFGYSTLMDLILLDKNGILFPTVGQKEQLYLAQLTGNKFYVL